MTTPAERIVLRNMTDEELIFEAKTMRKRASYAQGMADKMETELRRRRKIARRAIARANEGE